MFFGARQIWAIAFSVAVPLSFAGGFFWHRHLFQNVQEDLQQAAEKTKLTAKLHESELDQLKGKYEALKKDYDNLDADRNNVLIQTKQLLQEKSNWTFAIEEHDRLLADYDAQVLEKEKLKDKVGVLERNQAELLENWNLAQQRLPLKPIAPLE